MIKTKERIDAEIVKAAEQAGGVFRSRFGLPLLGMISFVESALVVPIITDPFLVAYILANRAQAMLAVTVTTLSSAFGGVVAYAMAHALFDFIAGRFLTGQHLAEFYVMAERFGEGVFVLTLLGAITPIPYTIVALAAGFVTAPFSIFLFATILGRGARYALVGYLTHRFGEQAMREVRERVTVLTIAAIALAVLYLIFAKL